jgi:hypothetical protein
MREKKFKCHYCGTMFSSEVRFLKHKCKQMKRDEEFNTPMGKSAWLMYQQWMKAYKRQVPQSKSFLHSKFYNSFIKFAKFAKQVNVPDMDLFIWLMKERDISPVIWDTDEVYTMYLEFIDRQGNPNKLAEVTIETLFGYTETYNCDISDIFEHVTPQVIIQHLRERRLTPWILLHSKKFKTFFINKTTTEDRIILESIIRPKYWTEKFNKNQKIVELMKVFIKELRI